MARSTCNVLIVQREDERVPIIPYFVNLARCMKACFAPSMHPGGITMVEEGGAHAATWGSGVAGSEGRAGRVYQIATEAPNFFAAMFVRLLRLREKALHLDAAGGLDAWINT